MSHKNAGFRGQPHKAKRTEAEQRADWIRAKRILDDGYPLKVAARRVGASIDRLHQWRKKFST